MKHAKYKIKTPFGDALCALDRNGAIVEFVLADTTESAPANETNPVAAQLQTKISEYFAGTRKEFGLQLSQIGEELGGRDHSTISHGANKIGKDILEDPYVEQAVTQVSRLLK